MRTGALLPRIVMQQGELKMRDTFTYEGTIISTGWLKKENFAGDITLRGRGGDVSRSRYGHSARPPANVRRRSARRSP